MIFMTTGEKIARLRKENNYTQEQLAALLGVSRQAISKWESDGAWPETDKLIRLSDLFGCTVDYLLKENAPPTFPAAESPGSACGPQVFLSGRLPYGFQYTSKRRVLGMPLVHVTWSHRQVSKGFIAIGLRAKGVISLGLLPMGVVSIGLFPVGILSFGTFALGLVAAGAFALGLLLAMGAIAIGPLALGAVAMGLYASGALGYGWLAAWGDEAYSHGIAIAQSYAQGAVSLFRQPRVPGEPTTYLFHNALYTTKEVRQLVLESAPAFLRWLAGVFVHTF